MKIEGMDPVIMDRIREEAAKDVKETVKPDVEDRNRLDQKREDIIYEQPSPIKERDFLEDMEEAVKKMNETVDAFHKHLRFKLHEASERWMVQVINIQEDEIIREIPTEDLLNVVAQIQTLIGILLDDRR